MLAKSSSERYANLGVVAHELSRVCSHHRKNLNDESSPTTIKVSVAAANKQFFEHILLLNATGTVGAFDGKYHKSLYFLGG